MSESTPQANPESHQSTPGSVGGRRSAAGREGRRRLDPTLLAALVVVLVAAGLVLLTRAEPTGVGGAAPGEEPLTRASLACPTYGDDVRTATTTEREGTVTTRSGGSSQDVDVSPRRSARVPGEDGQAVVVRAEGDLAPGLVAARSASPAAVAACTPPAFDQWFTGVGAGAEHTSVLELTNPDGGRAVVDVTVLGRGGVLDVPRLQGLAVPGNQTVRLDLSEVVPRREDLTVRVQTSRGRVSSALLDRVAQVGRPELGPDWLVPQADPSTTNVLLGTPPGRGDRFLTLANPGSDEGRARVEVVTGSSVFTPEGAEEVVVPPGSTVRVPVGALLAPGGGDAGGGGGGDADTPLGLRVSSTVPLTAAVRSEVGDDLALTTAGAPTDRVVAALVPGGRKQLVLGGATSSGTVTVRAWSGRGRELPADDLGEVDVEAGRASTLDLPGQARLVVLTPSGAEVTSAVVVDGDGAAVVAPRLLQLTGAVPQVVPGAP